MRTALDSLTIVEFDDPQFEVLAASRGGDGRSVTMLAVPYGKVAIVGGTGGATRERLLAGVFTRSIAERGDSIPFTSGHWSDNDPMRDPARVMASGAQWQDSGEGLRATVRIVKSPAGDHLLAQIHEGVIGGVSVGYAALHARSRQVRDGLQPPLFERIEAKLGHVAFVDRGAFVEAKVERVAAENDRSSSQAHPRLTSLDAQLALLRLKHTA